MAAENSEVLPASSVAVNVIDAPSAIVAGGASAKSMRAFRGPSTGNTTYRARSGCSRSPKPVERCDDS